MNKKIIAICGLQGSGKDTTADKLLEIANFKGLKVGKMAFADRLKDTVAVLFDLPRDQLAGFTLESSEWREQPLPNWSQRLGRPITPRHLLQQIGSELLRDQFHKSIWIDCLMDSIEKSDKDLIVITDCRYPNEINALKLIGATFIEIKRNVPDWYYQVLDLDDYIPENIHQSEYKWIKEINNIPNKIDLINSGTLEELYEKIYSIYEKL